MESRQIIQINPKALESKLVEIHCDLEDEMDATYYATTDGPFLGIDHARHFLENTISSRDYSGHTIECDIVPYESKGALDGLFEICFDSESGATQLFDMARQPIFWNGKEDKRQMNTQEISSLLDFLRIFGHNFQPLQDINSTKFWIHTRVYEDGREKEVNKRYRSGDDFPFDPKETEDGWD